MQYAGVNPVDTYIRSGNYAFKPDLPSVPGLDGAGVVDKLGAGVTHLTVGERVFVASTPLDKQGTYAEKVVRDAKLVHKLPDTVDWAAGAALGSPASTAYHALFDKAHLKKGETILVHGASGSVGLFVVQLAVAAGAQVIGTAGTTDGMALVKKAGAVQVLNHHQPAYLEAIKQVDLVIEMLANVNLEKDLQVLRKFGRIVIIGNRGSLDFNPRFMMNVDATVLGMSLWNMPLQDYQANLTIIEQKLQAGILQPYIGKVFPLAQAAQAQVAALDTQVKGKIVLQMP